MGEIIIIGSIAVIVLMGLYISVSSYRERQTFNKFTNIREAMRAFDKRYGVKNGKLKHGRKK